MVVENEEPRLHSQVTMDDRDDGDGNPIDRKIDELLALLGHELRNPLAAIRNAHYVLRLRGGDTAMREWVREVLERQTNQMGNLIEALLKFARFSSGKAHVQKLPVDLAQLVAVAIETVRPAIDDGGHRLEVNLPEARVTLKADPALLADVLTNLLANAIKYTDPGRRIGLTAMVDGADIVFRVRDTGIGISAELLPHVFDLYWQSSLAVNRSRGGLGIGLALVRQIVLMHGGSVSATSDGIGKGSEFVVRLPGVKFAEANCGTLCAEERA